jgi:hypothetical protein
MTVNKDQAIQEWVQTYAGRESALFHFLDASADSFGVVPIPGNAVVTPYIDGSAYKRYDFALQATQPYSQTTDDVNTQNMYIMRQWQDWVDEQQAAGHYPDFGPKCTAYRLVNGGNMPQLSAVNKDESTAKYQFISTLFYLEER